MMLDTINPKQQMYFTELNQQQIVRLVRDVSPSSSIGELIKKINLLLPQYDTFTYNVPFKLMRETIIDARTSQLLIYRDGKMYGFLLTYNTKTGTANVTGFVLDQDINTYMGFDDDITQRFSKEVNNASWTSTDVNFILQQQASAIMQDRGLSSSSFV